MLTLQNSFSNIKVLDWKKKLFSGSIDISNAKDINEALKIHKIGGYLDEER